MKALLIVLVVLFFSVRAEADDSGLWAIPPGEDVISAVKKGDRVPFDGQLFDINTALRWGNWLEQYRQKVDAETIRSKKMCETEIRYQQGILDIEVERYMKLSMDVDKRLLRSEQARVSAEHARDNPPFYKSFWFGLGVGVVTTSALVLVGSQAF